MDLIKCLPILCAALFSTAVSAQECDIEPIDYKDIISKKSGFQFKASFDFFAKMGISFGQFSTQDVSDEVQNMEKRLEFLVANRNKCIISPKEFKKGLDAIIAYEDSVSKFSASLKKVEDNTRRLDTLRDDSYEREQLLINIKKESEKLKTRYRAIYARQNDLEEKIETLPSNIRDKLKMDSDFNSFVREVTAKAMDSITQRVNTLEVKVQKLERTLSKIMSMYHKGELRNTHWIYGASGSASFVNDDYSTSVYLNSEFILPNKKYPILSRVAPFVEIGRTFWKEEKSYPTLPGGPEVSYTEQNGYYYYGAGIRKYFAWRYSFSWFLGAHVGYTDEVENEGVSDWSYGVLGGLNYYPAESSIKVSAEFRYSKISLSEETRTFNPFGDAETVRESNDYYLPTLMISIGKAY